MELRLPGTVDLYTQRILLEKCVRAMGKNTRRNKKGGSSAPSNTMDKYIVSSVAEDVQKSEKDETTNVTSNDTEKGAPTVVVTGDTRVATPELVQEKELPKTPSIRYETIYPDPDEKDQERDVDCLLPGKSPLKSGDVEGDVSYSDVYKEIASPKIPQREQRATSDSSATEIEKVTETNDIAAGETEEDLSDTWRVVDEDKDEDISVLTENLLTPVKDTSSSKDKSTMSSYREPKQYESLESGSSRYRDIIEDYLSAISDALVAIVAFFKPNSKYQHYGDYLKSKVNYILWPLTFIFPNIVIEMTRFVLVTYLLFLGSCFFLFWYSVRYSVWLMFSPWRFFQRAMGWLFQIFVYLTVGFVNNARGGNKIPTALNGHVTKH